ncbi:MAG: SBBP repeat-containing protein [Acidobacteriia bacterium]|nr:SBBP repeat-containing protein [Terriglobia bacterium]
MDFASRPCRYATNAASLFAALFYLGSASAQTPGMKLISFGGNDQESLAGFAIDHDGNYYIAGTTASLDLPVNVLQKHPGGAYLYRFRAGRADPLYPWPAPVSAIASDPSHPGYLYASFNRAIWKSPDSGDTWQHLDADWPTDSDCNGITVASKDGRSIYVLCAPFFPAHQMYAGQVLFRSTDAGATWTRARIDQQILGYDLPNYARLSNLTADPFNPQSLWAAAEVNSETGWTVGLHSTDGGDTWTETPPVFLQVAFDDRRPGVAYAIGDGFYRSGDSGQTWTKLTGASQPTDYWLDHEIAILPSGGALFLWGDLLQRTRDNGATWQTLPLPGSGRPCYNLYGGPDSALRADPLTGSVYFQVCGFRQSFIFRSDDAGTNWVRVNAFGLPALTGQAISPAPTGADYFAIVRSSSDVFVAKLSPSGDMIWSTFLGGVHDETATGLAIDPGNNVYVIGTTLSDDLIFTGAPLAKGLPDTSITPKSFVAKLSPDGTRLLYSTLFAYDATARGIAIDSSGAVYITGYAGPSLPTTPGVVRPAGGGPFVLKLDPSGARVIYGTFLAEGSYSVVNIGFPASMPLVANAIVVDSDGRAYVGGTYIWRLNADATDLVTSTMLFSTKSCCPNAVNAVAVDANRNLYVGGGTDTLVFATTAGAFQTELPPTECGWVWDNNVGSYACSATPAFVTKFNPDLSQFLYSTYLGGDGWDVARSLAVAPDGTVYAAGHTTSRTFPTKLPLQGSSLPSFGQTGFLSALLPNGSDIAFSTYISDGREMDAMAVALDPAGNPVIAGHNVGPSPSSGACCTATPDSDILIFRLDYSHAGNLQPRLDSILNAASRIGMPLAPGQRVALQGAGFLPDSQVCFHQDCVSPLAVAAGEILAVPPASIPGGGLVAVSVQSPGGGRSNEVLMSIGPAQLALYSADNTGTGQALALNEDGTLNSPANPAHRGSVVTLPANGFDPSAPFRFGFPGSPIYPPQRARFQASPGKFH